MGAALHADIGTIEKAVSVRKVEKEGLYNPQTVHGDIVVDGIVASVYTEAVQPRVAHAMLAPMRAVRDEFGWSVGHLREMSMR